MKRLPTTLLAISLVVAACAPARLERLRERGRHIQVAEPDLARAFDGAGDPAAARSLGRWIEQAFRSGAARSPVKVGRHTVHFHPGGEGIFAADYFDRLEPADRYRVVGLEHHRTEGAGVAMTGHRENRKRETVEKWYPPEAITRAVTAVAIPGATRGETREVKIRLIDRWKVETVMIGGNRQVLAADFTVPFAALLENTRALATTGITSVIRQRSGREAGFALLEPYDPKRTPLILIHGLFSTPLAWAELTNELWADPTVRGRYQIWHYLYPTNAPPLYSARIMRGQYDELRRFLDPSGKDRAMQRSVVIAHSMGGILAKSLVVDPKDAFWDPIFTRPLSSLNLTNEERATMKEAFYWKPRREVDRVIFCSVPFDGSTFAASWVARIGKPLVAPSHSFSDFFESLEKKNPGIWQPAYSNLPGRSVTSIVSLAPKQRSMEIFKDLPIVRGTASHVIKGSHDFFVSPSSSEVPGAESTLTVPSGHGSFHHPKAIAEIKRILALPAER